MYTSTFISSTSLCMVLCVHHLYISMHMTCHIPPCHMNTTPIASFVMVMQKILLQRLGGTHVEGTCVHIDFYQLNKPVYGVVCTSPVYFDAYDMPHTTLSHEHHPHSLIRNGHAENTSSTTWWYTCRRRMCTHSSLTYCMLVAGKRKG